MAETADDWSLALDLEAPPIYYNKADYIQTASGNKVSRNSVLCGSQNITLVGNSVIKPGTVLRGDLQLLKIGKHVIVGENCVLRPSHKKYKGSIAFFPMTIGDHVTAPVSILARTASFPNAVSSRTTPWCFLTLFYLQTPSCRRSRSSAEILVCTWEIYPSHSSSSRSSMPSRNTNGSCPLKRVQAPPRPSRQKPKLLHLERRKGTSTLT
ncbi:Dynactin subunit 5 [Durusdinium trenchii]|uniref:Dynactin subunit 5 n=1 Tax=Durusdinium trenchii TaxID=1381693 RepID=A0ABP0HTU1_9DINO